MALIVSWLQLIVFTVLLLGIILVSFYLITREALRKLRETALEYIQKLPSIPKGILGLMGGGGVA